MGLTNAYCTALTLTLTPTLTPTTTSGLCLVRFEKTLDRCSWKSSIKRSLCWERLLVAMLGNYLLKLGR